MLQEAGIFAPGSTMAVGWMAMKGYGAAGAELLAVLRGTSWQVTTASQASFSPT